jgi:predicted Zn-ribbon and HTH transcriptional regulator
MSKEGTSLINYDSERLIAKTRDRSPSSLPIFVLYDTCYWCATYFDKTKIPIDNNCPQCSANNNELTSFPVVSNESFTFDYNDKR